MTTEILYIIFSIIAILITVAVICIKLSADRRTIRVQAATKLPAYLTELEGLYAQGILTQAEYEAIRSQYAFGDSKRAVL